LVGGGLKVKLNNKMYNINISQFLKEKISPKLVIGGKEKDVGSVIAFLKELQVQLEQLIGYKYRIDQIIEEFNDKNIEEFNDKNIEEKLVEAKEIEKYVEQINIQELYDNIKITLAESYKKYRRKIPIDGEEFNDDQIKKFIEHQALENNMDLLIDNIEKEVGKHNDDDDYNIAELFDDNSDNIDGSPTIPRQSLDGFTTTNLPPPQSLEGSTKNLAGPERYKIATGQMSKPSDIPPPYRNNDESTWFINGDKIKTNDFIDKIIPYYYVHEKTKESDQGSKKWKKRNNFNPAKITEIFQPGATYDKIFLEIHKFLGNKNFIEKVDKLLGNKNYKEVVNHLFYGYKTIRGGGTLNRTNKSLAELQICRNCFNYLSYEILSDSTDSLQDYRKFYEELNKVLNVHFLSIEDQQAIKHIIDNTEKDETSIRIIKNYFGEKKNKTVWQSIRDLFRS
jgi:hypothetical protein